MSTLVWTVMALLALLFGAGCGFIAGALFEHGRPGGTADLEDQVERLRVGLPWLRS